MCDYDIVRSKRKTVGILVKDGKVTVKAPIGLSKRDIDLFVEKNREWIEKKLALETRKKTRFADFLSCNKFMFGGKVLEIRHSDNKSVRISDAAIYLPEHADISEQKTKIIREYKRAASERLKSRLDILSDYMGERYERFMLTNARSKWGSCSSERLVRLNWRLVMLPGGLSDYVVVHELCHIKFMDHSSKFWKLVESYIPDYKKRKKLLKEYSPIMDVLR